MKIITKVLENRLGKITSNILHPDQTGLIPGRSSFGNVRKILHIIYYIIKYRTGDKAATWALEAQDVFDTTECPCLLTLRRFGFGDTFIIG